MGLPSRWSEVFSGRRTSRTVRIGFPVSRHGSTIFRAPIPEQQQQQQQQSGTSNAEPEKDTRNTRRTEQRQRAWEQQQQQPQLWMMIGQQQQQRSHGVSCAEYSVRLKVREAAGSSDLLTRSDHPESLVGTRDKPRLLLLHLRLHLHGPLPETTPSQQQLELALRQNLQSLWPSPPRSFRQRL